MTTRKAQMSSRPSTWVLVLASVASLMAALDAMVVSSALTTIRLDLGASIEQLKWTRELGGVFGIAILVAVFAGAGSYASADAFSDGFNPAIAVSAALSLIGAIAGLGLPARPQPTRAPRRPQPVPALGTEGGA